VVTVFILFFSRQNLISLLVEVFVIYNLAWRKVNLFKILIIFLGLLMSFSILGDMRIGYDIKELAKIKEEFKFIPNIIVWLFSYSYFNILNLDNVVTTYLKPLFDLSSMSTIIPSFIRPEYVDADELLEVSNFTVGSYILPIYRDLGSVGLFLFVAVVSLYTKKIIQNVNRTQNFRTIASYSVLYFCFMFSFFANFWLYLPIIFQLIIFNIFDKYFLVKKDL
jgi:oligosaccharide repeat unit polymerase